MWHEIRKQERKIKGMIVDYKRRAERRKDYYLKIKADPTQFLQVHGRQCKIHLDPSVAAAGDSASVMMNWAGSPDVVIDRFDVRAHLDHINDHKPTEPESELSYDERYINYERYRILVQNEFLGVPEEKFLHQLHLEEQYGASSKTGFVPIEGKKKVPGAAIGYNYEDPTQTISSNVDSVVNSENEGEEGQEEEDDSDMDFDVCVDVSQVTNQQAHELNKCSHDFGMDGNDYFSFLTKDKEEAENLRLAKELEEEKAMYSGRKSRRERRAYREKKLAGRKISPPSYASRRSPTYQDYKRQLRSQSKSKSPSPDNSGQITYITSFGDEEHSEHRRKSSGKDSKSKMPLPRKTASRSSYSSYSSHRYSSRSPTHQRHTSDRYHHSRTPEYIRRSPHKYSRSSKSPGRNRRSPRSPRRHRDRSTSPPGTSRHSPALDGYKSMSGASSQEDIPRSTRSPPRAARSTGHSKHGDAQSSSKNPPLPRYYGRRREKSSSSELSLSEGENSNASSATSKTYSSKGAVDVGNSSGRTKPGSSGNSKKLTQQERLKRKMQIMLNRQYKADKRAEKEKFERVMQERLDRQDEMRELSIKLRKRERMRRHEYYAELERERRRSNSRSSRSSSRSNPRSRSRSPTYRKERSRRSRSRSSYNSEEEPKRGLVDY